MVSHRGSDSRWLSGVHRLSSAVIGVALWVIGGLGFSNNLGFFSTSGAPVLGLSTNGLLSTLSLVFGTVLVGAAVIGGRFASTVGVVVGALFLLSGVGNVLVLNGPYNILAFRMPNVIFSLLVGLILLVLGAYGRFSGRLPDDNPNAARQKHVVDAEGSEDRGQRLPTDPADAAAARSLAEAERAAAGGGGTDEERRKLAEVDGIRDGAERRAAWRRLTGS